MKRARLALMLALVAALASAAGASAEGPLVFVVPLTGAEEVPPRATPAAGIAVVSTDGTRISYEVRVSNISNVIAAHIHLGRPGENGPIVLTLATRTPIRGSFTGVLASVTDATPQALEGPLAGQPLATLIPHMLAGNTYVNVHTNDAVDPPNTGPGDFPGGEIRGQLHPQSVGGFRTASRQRGGRPSGTAATLPSGRGAAVDAELARVRTATLRFHSVAVAEAEGYVRASPCVSSPAGVMGIHYTNPRLTADDAINIEQPEELLYFPEGNTLRLMGVEYHKRDADQNLATAGDRPSLFGVPFDGPMPGHGPPFDPGPVHYDLHVWLWQFNPAGIFAQWNPSLSCP